jgi:chromosome segregation ATPase
MNYAIDQINETIERINKQISENNESITSLKDSVFQLTSLSREISGYTSQVFDSLKSSDDSEKSLQIAVSSLLEIRNHLARQPENIAREIASVSSSQQVLLEMRKRENDVIDLIVSHREKIDEIKEDITLGKTLKRKVGMHPEKIKDIREARVELAEEQINIDLD